MGSGGKRDSHQERHDMRTVSSLGADRLRAQQQCCAEHCCHCGEVQKIAPLLFVSADKIQTTEVFGIRFFLPPSSKGWSLPSFKSSSTHGRDGCLLLVSCFSFSPLVFFIITPIKTHIIAIKTGVREEKSAMAMEMWSLSSKFSSFYEKERLKREEQQGSKQKGVELKVQFSTLSCFYFSDTAPTISSVMGSCC